MFSTQKNISAKIPKIRKIRHSLRSLCGVESGDFRNYCKIRPIDRARGAGFAGLRLPFFGGG